MKRHLFPLLLCLMGASLSAQSAGKSREVGLQFSDINFNGVNNFSAFYKKQVGENTYRRIRFAAGSLGFSTDDNENNRFNTGASVGIGREKRKQLDKKLWFYRGTEFRLASNFLAFNDTNAFTGIVGGALVFGLQHNFNDLWAVNLEATPGADLVFQQSGETWHASLQAGLSNLASIGVVRKF